LAAAPICIFLPGVKENLDRSDPARQAGMRAENLGKEAEDGWDQLFLFHEGFAVHLRIEPAATATEHLQGGLRHGDILGNVAADIIAGGLPRARVSPAQEREKMRRSLSVFIQGFKCPAA
jgi:hypothetical protein